MVQVQSCKGYVHHRIRGKVSGGVLLHWILHSSTKSEKCQFIAKNGELQDGEVTTLYNVTEENLRKEERAKLIASMNIAL